MALITMGNSFFFFFFPQWAILYALFSLIMLSPPYYTVSTTEMGETPALLTKAPLCPAQCPAYSKCTVTVY